MCIPKKNFIQSDYTVVDVPNYDDDQSDHTMTVHGDNGKMSYSCVKTTNTVIQLGRQSINQICIPSMPTTQTMPRYCMRICLDFQTNELFVKAAGFDLNGDIFLPETKTVLGPNQYSTTNPLLMINPPVDLSTIDDIVKGALYINVNGEQYSSINNHYEKLLVQQPTTGWYMCGRFVIHLLCH
jgi:hypothetical protein